MTDETREEILDSNCGPMRHVVDCPRCGSVETEIEREDRDEGLRTLHCTACRHLWAEDA